ncbi:hypothetical protein BDV96DRAFT_567997 [Lophiotrema nucula]|uniref:Uncharacterized protein n=1 Tax=Lophiotrema nucula TaxID=690887 RepID=A0A6A5ZN65_9PLEO|nr:hypothetical protein BDV96DRAFT_567997 [Lophiotrema nucula]
MVFHTPTSMESLALSRLVIVAVPGCVIPALLVAQYRQVQTRQALCNGRIRTWAVEAVHIPQPQASRSGIKNLWGHISGVFKALTAKD